MKTSINFEFIRGNMPQAAQLGWCAEQVLHIDPGSALTRLRGLCEVVVNEIYEQENLNKNNKSRLSDLMKYPQFKECIDKSLYYKLDQLRLAGNKTAHGAEGKLREACIIMGTSHSVISYMAIHYFGFRQQAIPDFVDVPDAKLQQQQEIEALKAQLQDAEKQAIEQSQKLEEERGKRKKVEADEQQRAKAQARSQDTALSLQWNEAKTRAMLIDTMLQDAGWDVTDSNQVGIEVDTVSPIDGRNLRVDYVLWGEDQLPLAVVEAKRASEEDLSSGREQAREYAAALEQETGQRPVIFVSNGYETEMWDDARENSARDVYGFYDRDNLHYLVKFQRQYKTRDLEKHNPNKHIADRDYQIEAIKAVAKRFQPDHKDHARKALIVQATGTGKTRVAIALCDLLTQHKWARRILFLCDRKELRRQADEAFKHYLPSEARCVVGESNKIDHTARVYIATYPGMMNRFAQCNVGFFDLIIADESHRSIYNKYRELFDYFDAYQVGLTATPVKFVDRHTFSMFQCEATKPSFEFGYEDAIKQHYLVPYLVKDYTTEFLREGICYSDLSPEQKKQLEEDLGEEQAKLAKFAGKDIGRKIQSDDTDKYIMQNLMDNGIKGSKDLVGKSIVFAQRQEHAQNLQRVFKELYPQHGDRVCKVIHNKVRNAEALIKEFKQKDNDFRIAISVDMLDTGIDVPSVVNLVFAKSVGSWVKFHQMIGRGTRLCPQLFGPADPADYNHKNHKQEFRIYDHFGNFAFFEEEYDEIDQKNAKSSLQHLFEARMALATEAQKQGLVAVDAYDIAIGLLATDINDLPQDAVAVKRQLRDVHILQQTDALKNYSATTRHKLQDVIAPLMGQRVLQNIDALNFDRSIAALQLAVLQKASRLADLKAALLAQLDTLAVNIDLVRDKLPLIDEIKSKAFWDKVSVPLLESVRTELRDIVQYKKDSIVEPFSYKRTSTKEDATKVEEFERTVTITDEAHALAYREETARTLKKLLDNNPILTQVYEGQQVTQEELDNLVSSILVEYPLVDVRVLNEFYGRTAKDLQLTLRNLIGLDLSYVKSQFASFLQSHPELTHKQVRFLNLLQRYISEHGSITQGQLFQTPFSDIDPAGIGGVFEVADLQNLVGLLTPFMADSDATGQQGTSATE